MQLDKINGLLRLLRPLNVVLFFAGVALGGLLAGGVESFSDQHLWRMVLAMVSAALIGGAANAINDVYDVEIDHINRPDRPIPAGTVSLEAARRLWLAFTLTGVALGVLVSPLHGVLAGVAAFLLWAYSARLKRTPGWGNVAVALVIFLAILYGGLVPSGGKSGAVLTGALFAFLTTLAREGVKDIEDMEGDAALGARTLPLVWGAHHVARLVVFITILTVVALPIPALMSFGTRFLGLAVPVAFCLLLAAWMLIAGSMEGSPDAWRRRAGASSSWLKIGMVAGIAALALAGAG